MKIVKPILTIFVASGIAITTAYTASAFSGRAITDGLFANNAALGILVAEKGDHRPGPDDRFGKDGKKFDKKDHPGRDDRFGRDGRDGRDGKKFDKKDRPGKDDRKDFRKPGDDRRHDMRERGDRPGRPDHDRNGRPDDGRGDRGRN